MDVGGRGRKPGPEYGGRWESGINWTKEQIDRYEIKEAGVEGGWRIG
jgi:hypothetical protein